MESTYGLQKTQNLLYLLQGDLNNKLNKDLISLDLLYAPDLETATSEVKSMVNVPYVYENINLFICTSKIIPILHVTS